MVNVGDTVAVTVRTWWPEVALFSDLATPLQRRLEGRGFRVLRVDDSGLHWSAEWGDLLVTLVPLSSAYGTADDIASIVAGAAIAVGYGAAWNEPNTFNGIVIGQAGPSTIDYGNAQDPWTRAPAPPYNGLPSSQQIEQNMRSPSAHGDNGNDDSNNDEAPGFNLSTGLILGGFALALVLALTMGGGRR